MAHTPTFNPWIKCFKVNPQAKLRLFCFPYAGSGPSAFRLWPDGLPATVEVCPIHLPGRESRLNEPLLTELPPLIQLLGQALHPYLDRPYAFFGHSLGALMSFELVRQLQRQNDSQPAYLFVSGHRAPHIPDPDPPMHYLPEAELMEWVRRLNGTPEEVLQEKELMQVILPILRADFALCETYAYTSAPPLGYPILAFGGSRDARTTYQSLEAWREHTTSSFTLRMFPGDHFFLHSSQTLLLRILSRELYSIAK